MTKGPHRQADALAVLSEQHEAWGADLKQLADRARALAEVRDLAAIRAGVVELADALSELAAMLAPAVC
jgi:hypothetical protein